MGRGTGQHGTQAGARAQARGAASSTAAGGVVPEREAAMAAAYASGETLLAVARRFHVGINHVRAAVIACGGESRNRGRRVLPPLDQETTAAVVRAYAEEGCTTEELALRHRTSGKRVRAALRQAGVELRNYALTAATGLTGDDEAEIARLYQDGAGLRELARRYRCSVPRVREVVVRRGIPVRRGRSRR